MNINKRVGRILIGERIGSGGFGDIYSGIDTSLNRKVAIKIIDLNLNKNKEILEIIKNGIMTQGQINHPNIISVYSFEKINSKYYIIFEYVSGHSLQYILDKKKRKELVQAIKYIKQILRGLNYAHSLNIVHFDIKPSNILITNSDNVKITDFGIAQLFGMSSKRDGEKWYGTPDYASPEQIQGLSSDFRSDIYSFGITIFYMLTGKLPYVFNLDENIALEKILKEDSIEIPNDLDPKTRKFIDLFLLKAIRKNVEMRYQNALEMLEVLDNIDESL